MTSVLYLSLVYGLALLGIVLFALLANRCEASSLLAFLIMLALLLFKVIEDIYLGLHGQAESLIPFEYSHIIYYLSPLLILLGAKRLRYSGGILAFIAGLGYLIGAAFAYETTLNFTMYVLVKGLVIHELLFFTGLVELFSVAKFKRTDYWPFLALMAGMTIYISLLCFKVILPDYPYYGTPFSFQFLTGDIGTYIFNTDDLSLWERILSMLLTLLCFFAVTWGALALNMLCNGRKEGMPKGKHLELGLLPLLRLWGRHGK